MNPNVYPFTAIVGQEQMKLALLLAAVDWRLGVLLRGDKGAGKTTTARGLALLLPEHARFVNLPIGATEDRILGGLNLERTLKGDPVLKPGLLSEAHRGVLYIDEVNLLPAHLGDALLDAASSGVNVVEREGLSASHPAEFVLLGSMNPEEGLLRPQLLDRFALCADISAPLETAERLAIVERRLAFERDPAQFAEKWSIQQAATKEKIRAARASAGAVACPAAILARIENAICTAGVRSLRADLAAVRASIAYAALLGDNSVAAHHADAVLPLVLNHRTQSKSRSAPPPSQPPQTPAPSDQNAQETAERIFAPREVSAPAIKIGFNGHAPRGNSQAGSPAQPGPVTGARRTETPQEIDLRATLNHVLLETGTAQPRVTDLHEKVRAPRAGMRYLFLIDSSGSHAAQEKMRLVKGAALGLLERSFHKDDEVAIIVFRGAGATVLLEPSRVAQDASSALEYLPTGGRTPLAHALQLAETYLTPSTLLIVLSDGRANVALQNGDPWQDALQLATHLHCNALVVDTENAIQPIGRARELARALQASCITLAELEIAGEIRIDFSSTAPARSR
jgi:magnesium chelatase subunit D